MAVALLATFHSVEQTHVLLCHIPDILNGGNGCMKKEEKLHLSNLYVPDIAIVVFGELKNVTALFNPTSIH